MADRTLLALVDGPYASALIVLLAEEVEYQ